MWCKDGDNRLLVRNNYGEMVPGKIKRLRSFTVLHETIAGLWVKKVTAVKQGLALTGRSKKIETKPCYTIVGK